MKEFTCNLCHKALPQIKVDMIIKGVTLATASGYEVHKLTSEYIPSQILNQVLGEGVPDCLCSTCAATLTEVIRQAYLDVNGQFNISQAHADAYDEYDTTDEEEAGDIE